MIYFLAPGEGQRFIRIVRKGSMRPKEVIKLFREGEDGPILVFKCGMIYDPYIKRYCGTVWRHKVYGGRKLGKALYKELMQLKLCTEYVQGIGETE